MKSKFGSQRVSFMVARHMSKCQCGNKAFTIETIKIDDIPVDLFFRCTKCKERTGASIGENEIDWLVREKLWGRKTKKEWNDYAKKLGVKKQ